MLVMRTIVLGLLFLAGVSGGQTPVGRPAPPFVRPATGPASFFVTSVGMGRGADLGGLPGADRHCTALADAAGLEGRIWRAYLSTQADGKTRAINARDRIGTGPWFNVKGVRVAANLDVLHGDTLASARTGNTISQVVALNEKGEKIPGEDESPRYHDILTGTQLDGRAYHDRFDRTCSNWTSSSTGGSAQVGHSDRDSRGLSISWNSAHQSVGCSAAKLEESGGGGLFYCFAADASQTRPNR